MHVLYFSIPARIIFTIKFLINLPGGTDLHTIICPSDHIIAKFILFIPRYNYKYSTYSYIRHLLFGTVLFSNASCIHIILFKNHSYIIFYILTPDDFFPRTRRLSITLFKISNVFYLAFL